MDVDQQGAAMIVVDVFPRDSIGSSLVYTCHGLVAHITCPDISYNPCPYTRAPGTNPHGVY